MTLSEQPASGASISQQQPELIGAPTVAFFPSGRLDVVATRMALQLTGQHLDGAFVAGTTGEFLALTSDERREVTELALEELGPERVVVHVSEPSLFQLRNSLAQAREQGVQRVALLTPYYYGVDFEAVAAWYQRAIDLAEGMEVTAYLFAERTGNRLTLDEIRRLSKIHGIRGFKVSGAPPAPIADLATIARDDLDIYLGTDHDVPTVLASGLHGIVSGIAAVFPRLFLAARHEAQVSDPDSNALTELGTLAEMFVGSPLHFKIALSEMGIGSPVCRIPQNEPSPELVKMLRRAARSVAENYA